jgi:hypothetical protein
MTPKAPELELPAHPEENESKMTPMSKVAQPPLTEPTIWNTKNLGLRLASDFVSGASAATMVAPIITIIDKLVVNPSELPR